MTPLLAVDFLRRKAAPPEPRFAPTHCSHVAGGKAPKPDAGEADLAAAAAGLHPDWHGAPASPPSPAEAPPAAEPAPPAVGVPDEPEALWRALQAHLEAKRARLVFEGVPFEPGGLELHLRRTVTVQAWFDANGAHLEDDG